MNNLNIGNNNLNPYGLPADGLPPVPEKPLSNTKEVLAKQDEQMKLPRHKSAVEKTPSPILNLPRASSKRTALLSTSRNLSSKSIPPKISGSGGLSSSSTSSTWSLAQSRSLSESPGRAAFLGNPDNPKAAEEAAIVSTLVLSKAVDNAFSSVNQAGSVGAITTVNAKPPTNEELTVKLFQNMVSANPAETSVEKETRLSKNSNTDKEIILGYKLVMSTNQLIQGLSKAYDTAESIDEKEKYVNFALSWMTSNIYPDEAADEGIKKLLTHLANKGTKEEINNAAQLTMALIEKPTNPTAQELSMLLKTYGRLEVNAYGDKKNILIQAQQIANGLTARELAHPEIASYINKLIDKGNAEENDSVKVTAEDLHKASIKERECKSINDLIKQCKGDPATVAKELGSLLGNIQSQATLSSLIIHGTGSPEEKKSAKGKSGMDCAEAFNNLVDAIVVDILFQNDKNKVDKNEVDKKYSFYLNVAKKCIDLKDPCTLILVSGALERGPILRLKLNEAKENKNSYQKIVKASSASQASKAMRDLYKDPKSESNPIPLFVLADLTNLKDGNPSKIPDETIPDSPVPDGLYNSRKFSIVAQNTKPIVERLEKLKERNPITDLNILSPLTKSSEKDLYDRARELSRGTQK